MTRNVNDDGPSRRAFLKGTLASGLVAGGATGSVLAQDQDGADVREFEALIFAGSFHPGARFEVTSEVLNYTPVVPQGAVTFGDYNSRVIKYRNTNERALLFPANEAEVQQGGVYEFSQSIAPVNQRNGQVWQVTFGRVSEATTTAGQTTTEAGGGTRTTTETDG